MLMVHPDVLGSSVGLAPARLTYICVCKEGPTDF